MILPRRPRLDRRRFLLGGAASLGALGLAGCDSLSTAPWFRTAVGEVDDATMAAQRALIGDALAKEFPETEISPRFRANGNRHAGQSPEWLTLVNNGFADYRLPVEGLVERPLSLSLADLRARPARTQITRHDCVEGWSCIGKWTGAPLGPILDEAGLKPEARFIVFHCFDPAGALVPGARGDYYESIDLVDARHPQTILAYDMNGQTLPIDHGAPLRLRVERQLGYKHAKYVRRIEVVDSFAGINGGNGGFWEDYGYEWYAGI